MTPPTMETTLDGFPVWLFCGACPVGGPVGIAGIGPVKLPENGGPVGTGPVGTTDAIELVGGTTVFGWLGVGPQVSLKVPGALFESEFVELPGSKAVIEKGVLLSGTSPAAFATKSLNASPA